MPAPARRLRAGPPALVKQRRTPLGSKQASVSRRPHKWGHCQNRHHTIVMRVAPRGRVGSAEAAHPRTEAEAAKMRRPPQVPAIPMMRTAAVLATTARRVQAATANTSCGLRIHAACGRAATEQAPHRLPHQLALAHLSKTTRGWQSTPANRINYYIVVILVLDAECIGNLNRMAS